MENPSRPPLNPDQASVDEVAPEERESPGAERSVSDLASLLKELDESHRALPVRNLPEDAARDNQLVQVRLGIASSLFMALRGRHAGTATHSLRVAMVCSSWSWVVNLSDEERDALEMAALLHDVGKVGIPDEVLLKPGALDAREAAVMNRHWQIGLEVLAASCANDLVLDIVRHARAWYDGSNADCPVAGEAIPLGARMLAIADAYDSMTSDQVYRPAMSHERSLEELYRHTGTQFDPELVRSFARRNSWDHAALRDRLSERWLATLTPEHVNAAWRRNAEPPAAGGDAGDSLFEFRMLENMQDAVVFVDSSLRITFWNRGAERMTGLSPEGVTERLWRPRLIRMADERGRHFADEACPLAASIESGAQSLRRLTIYGRSGREIAVDAHIMPVLAEDGTCRGATLLMHDVSSEISLEEQCQNLHELATKDPLTEVANRAEFDRMHARFVQLHRDCAHPCALIICDVDRFKQVNDTYGHQAGDEVLKTMAKLLRSKARAGDLVARYGGEEFVILCSDCDNHGAKRRAEEIRRQLASILHPSLGGKPVTASFGVTGIQGGDTPETMLRRADRALFQAKDAGRNMVVQLGSGCEDSLKITGGAPAAEKSDAYLIDQELYAAGPFSMAVQKLRGFIADHHARLVKADENVLEIHVGSEGGFFFRRATDRRTPLLITIHFEEQQRATLSKGEVAASQVIVTHMRVCMQAQRRRDRRKADTRERARQLFASLKAYLMAAEQPLQTDEGEPQAY